MTFNIDFSIIERMYSSKIPESVSKVLQSFGVDLNKSLSLSEYIDSLMVGIQYLGKRAIEDTLSYGIKLLRVLKGVMSENKYLIVVVSIIFIIISAILMRKDSTVDDSSYFDIPIEQKVREFIQKVKDKISAFLRVLFALDSEEKDSQIITNRRIAFFAVLLLFVILPISMFPSFLLTNSKESIRFDLGIMKIFTKLPFGIGYVYDKFFDTGILGYWGIPINFLKVIFTSILGWFTYMAFKSNGAISPEINAKDPSDITDKVQFS